jgi:hypothetical protein
MMTPRYAMKRILLAFAAVMLALVPLACTRDEAAPRALVLDGQGMYEIDDCLSYEPAVVELAGRVERQIFPGRPNYESIENGDEPDTYWILHLSAPVCTRQDDVRYYGAERDVTRMQLVLTREQYETYRPLLEQRVVARGTLMYWITGHHHTPVLLQAQSVRAVVPADSLP